MRPFEHTPGSMQPLGATPLGKHSWNFAVYSSNAKSVTLGLFQPGSAEPERRIELQRSGNFWHSALQGIDHELEYAYQADNGPWLLDPYALALTTSAEWNPPAAPQALRARLAAPTPFNWKGVEPPRIPKEELIIYEMHVRGFTKSPSSNVAAPGTYLGVIEKIPYLKELGINAVELMPIYEFNEGHGTDHPNYWGYNPISWFSPKRAFGQIDEFKTMVRELHKNGIEVILDVVYNHTGEGASPPLSWRGIDPSVYYMMDAHGTPRDYTGCGNTINTNHPVTQTLILDSLRYWIQEMHIDGFRFDLASIFTRAQDGHVLNYPPILQAMQADPILTQAKWIAEAWDAAGLYQLNYFPRFGPWSEWNGAYRDIIRRFIKGTNGKASRFANAMSGSDVIYASTHTPTSSINFITAHDGFTLRDLVSYNAKHNEANGEMNRDGADQNDSWNCGAEGETDDENVCELRQRQMRNFWLALLLAQGVPMILMGDEYGHTRQGNNNPYVQDNELNWFLWDELERNQATWKFVQGLIAFRKNHSELRRSQFLTTHDVSWHGLQPGNPNWSADSRLVAWSMMGGGEKRKSKKLYVAFNASFEAAELTFPKGKWRWVVNTNDGWDKHWFGGNGPEVEVSVVRMERYSALVLEEKEGG